MTNTTRSIEHIWNSYRAVLWPRTIISLHSYNQIYLISFCYFFANWYAVPCRRCTFGGQTNSGQLRLHFSQFIHPEVFVRVCVCVWRNLGPCINFITFLSDSEFGNFNLETSSSRPIIKKWIKKAKKKKHIQICSWLCSTHYKWINKW